MFREFLRDFIIQWGIVVVVIMVILMAILCCSCANWNYSHKQYDPAGNLVSEVIANGTERFIKSNIDQVNVKVTKTTRSITIGTINKSPDDEAVKAVAEGIVEGALPLL